MVETRSSSNQHLNSGAHSSSTTVFTGPWKFYLTMCHCRENAVLKTAYTKANLGRRFWTCAERKCKYFEWYDEEICDRGKGFGGKMVTQVRLLENELEKAKASTTEQITKLEKDLKKVQKEKKAVEKELMKQKKLLFAVILAVVIAGWVKAFM